MNASNTTRSSRRRATTGETQTARPLSLLRDLADELQDAAHLNADAFEGTLDPIDAGELVELVIPGVRFAVGQAISFLESRSTLGMAD